MSTSTENGIEPLAALAPIRLVDFKPAMIEKWAAEEKAKRPTSARSAMRLLRACLNWCMDETEYADMVPTNATRSKKTRELLGKPRVKRDLLQRDQLAAWFVEVQRIGNPVISAYLQTLLLVGPRREELAELRWSDVDFRWGSMKLKDKMKVFRYVPLTPYVAHLLSALPRRNEWVFSSPASKKGHIAEPRIAHNEAVAKAGLPHLTLHGLRRTFATLTQWLALPDGLAAEIQGHAPQGVRQINYIVRPLDMLRDWHVQIEEWMLKHAGIDFVPSTPGLHVVAASA